MPEFREIATKEVRVAHFNPVKRVERNKLTGLLLSIREHGILQPLVLAHDYTLADGHRRLACAKLLKMPCVPVSIYSDVKLSADALWVVLNADTMSLSPTQWLSAIDAGLPLDTPGFPESLRKRVEILIDLVGRDGIAQLVEQGRSPYIVDAAQRAVNYCGRKGDDAFFKQAIDWLIYVGNSFNIRSATSEAIPPDVLVEAITEAKMLTRVWEVSH